MHSIKACEIDVTAQIMYEENYLNAAYAFQSTTSVSFESLLIILTTAQKDLQGYSTGELNPRRSYLQRSHSLPSRARPMVRPCIRMA